MNYVDGSAEYKQGYDFRFAKKRGPCPYPEGTREHADWIAGYQAADDDEAW